MRPKVWFLLAGLVAGVVPQARGQDWIAHVKSAPQDYQGRTFRIDGEVLELLGNTAVSRQGLYRLADASDPSGILVRTTDLPQTSGPFEVTVQLAPELLYQGNLLLEEVRRREPFAWDAVAPLAVAALGVALLLLYLARYLAARRKERHQHLAPPMWLIPTADAPSGTPPAGGGEEQAPQLPAIRFNYRLQYIEQERSAALDRTKRTSLRGVAGASAITLASMAWFLIGVDEASGRPTFVLLAPVVEALGADTSAAFPRDTATVALTPPAQADPVPARPAPRQEPARPQATPTTSARTPDTSRPAVTDRGAARPGADPVRTQTQPREPVRTDTAPRVVAQPVNPAPAPPPPPPPPAPGNPATTDPAPREPARNPAADREAAAGIIAGARDRLVAAINGGAPDQIASLFSWTGNEGWKNRFIAHLRGNESTAGAGPVGEVTLQEGGTAEATFGITVRWRANFGVERRKDARFAGTVRRVGTEWRLSGIRLLEQFP